MGVVRSTPGACFRELSSFQPPQQGRPRDLSWLVQWGEAEETAGEHRVPGHRVPGHRAPCLLPSLTSHRPDCPMEPAGGWGQDWACREVPASTVPSMASSPTRQMSPVPPSRALPTRHLRSAVTRMTFPTCHRCPRTGSGGHTPDISCLMHFHFPTSRKTLRWDFATFG